MATATLEIRALTAGAFRTPEKFTEFCRNDGKPLGGIVDGEQIAGSMNATFETIDPGSQEVLATVCEMGEALRQLAGLFAGLDDGDHIGRKLPRLVKGSAQFLAGDDLGSDRADGPADRGHQEDVGGQIEVDAAWPA